MKNTFEKVPTVIRKAILKVSVTRAAWQVIDEMDKETKTSILANNDFLCEDTGKRILDPTKDFMMSTEDFERYHKLVYAANCNKGLDSGSWEFNFWDYRKAALDAEDELVDAVAKCVPEYTPEIVRTIKSNHTMREKLVNISLRAK